VLDRIVVNSAIELATSLPSSPALRAAAYRLLAAEPGVRSLGDVKDHTGRAGHAVALPSPYASAPELRLIFDKSTGMPLGTETVATRSGDGAREGETLSYTTITSMQWTDEAPPFDTDTPDPGPETPSDRRDGPSRCARAVHGGGTSRARGGTTSGSTGSRTFNHTVAVSMGESAKRSRRDSSA
jgi:hypothetical protein